MFTPPFFAYQILLTIALFALGLRLLSRRALVLRPVQIYLFLVVPVVFLVLFSVVQMVGSFLFAIMLCMSLLIVAMFLVGFWFIQRYANAAVIFNCVHDELIESFSQLLTKAGIPFSRTKDTFSVNQGKSTIQFFDGDFFFLTVINFRGNRFDFMPLLTKLRSSLQSSRLSQTSIIAFVPILFALLSLGFVVQRQFPDALTVDLRNAGAMINAVAAFGIEGFYLGGTLLAFMMIVDAFRQFIPRPIIQTRRMTRWIFLALVGWSIMILLATLSNYELSLLMVFDIIGMGLFLFLVLNASRMICVIGNLSPSTIYQSLRDAFQSQQLEFQEAGNVFKLKSGIVFKVVHISAVKSVSVNISFAALQRNLSTQENAVINQLKRQPGLASISSGLVLLFIGLGLFVYFLLPNLFSLLF